MKTRSIIVFFPLTSSSEVSEICFCLNDLLGVEKELKIFEFQLDMMSCTQESQSGRLELLSRYEMKVDKKKSNSIS